MEPDEAPARGRWGGRVEPDEAPAKRNPFDVSGSEEDEAPGTALGAREWLAAALEGWSCGMRTAWKPWATAWVEGGTRSMGIATRGSTLEAERASWAARLALRPAGCGAPSPGAEKADVQAAVALATRAQESSRADTWAALACIAAGIERTSGPPLAKAVAESGEYDASSAATAVTAAYAWSAEGR